MVFQKSACIEPMYGELPFLERFRAAKEDGFRFVEFWSWTDKDLEAVKAGMLALTTKGSVRQAFQDLPFRVGAKTGTAQTGGTSSNAHSVFVCFAPYDDPEVAVAMVVEHGEGGGDVSQMCADVLSYYFSSKETREEIPVENTLIR